ncbi:pyridoxamine 5'-phosphate oxidase family protein [Primorskyibacter sp. S87]|uniref:pyridoxamine 5'-phosphate oxidase family protein n=1 Tax=Primorskyibacter sp. S87 TaxID=3415126 RepID=UPI003C7A7541
MALAFANIAFTPSVRAQQDRNGSSNYARFLLPDRSGGDSIGLAEAAFVEARDGFYQATVSETGWPYVQFRGGKPGFLHVLDPKTIAYADLRGNRQYISLGNLVSDARVSLILMDYPNAQRLKIWGRATVADPQAPEFDGLTADPEAPSPERVIKMHVDAFDWNCPQHIPRRFTHGETVQRIEELERENARLLSALNASTS